MTDSDDNRVSDTQQLSFGATVAITVKERADTFGRVYHIHRHLIKARSSFVRKELQSQNKSQIRSFTLHDCSLKAFERYCHYIYTESIPCMTDSDDEADQAQQWQALVNLFLISKKLDDSEAMNDVLNALLHTYESNDSGIPSTSVISLVYEKTDTGSPLRRLMVDTYRWAATDETINDGQNELPPTFYADLTKALLREKGEVSGDIPEEVSCCDYHIHEGNGECPSRIRKEDESDNDDEDNDNQDEDQDGEPKEKSSPEGQEVG